MARLLRVMSKILLISDDRNFLHTAKALSIGFSKANAAFKVSHDPWITPAKLLHMFAAWIWTTQ